MTKKPVLFFCILTVLSSAIAVFVPAGAVEKQDLSSATAKTKQLPTQDASKSQVLKLAPEKPTVAIPRTMADIIPPGFRDDDDDSSSDDD